MNTTMRQRIGLALAMLLSLANIVSVLEPTPEGETGPPMLVLIISAVLGGIGLVGSVIAWRSGNRRVLRVVCGVLVLAALGAVPAFFVDVPAGLKAVVGVATLATVLSCVLMLSPGRARAAVEYGA